MPAITRKGDKSTGHDSCAPVKIVEVRAYRLRTIGG